MSSYNAGHSSAELGAQGGDEAEVNWWLPSLLRNRDRFDSNEAAWAHVDGPDLGRPSRLAPVLSLLPSLSRQPVTDVRPTGTYLRAACDWLSAPFADQLPFAQEAYSSDLDSAQDTVGQYVTRLSGQPAFYVISFDHDFRAPDNRSRSLFTGDSAGGDYSVDRPLPPPYSSVPSEPPQNTHGARLGLLFAESASGTGSNAAALYARVEGDWQIRENGEFFLDRSLCNRTIFTTRSAPVTRVSVEVFQPPRLSTERRRILDDDCVPARPGTAFSIGYEPNLGRNERFFCNLRVDFSASSEA